MDEEPAHTAARRQRGAEVVRRRRGAQERGCFRRLSRDAQRRGRPGAADRERARPPTTSTSWTSTGDKIRHMTKIWNDGIHHAAAGLGNVIAARSGKLSRRAKRRRRGRVRTVGIDADQAGDHREERRGLRRRRVRRSGRRHRLGDHRGRGVGGRARLGGRHGLSVDRLHQPAVAPALLVASLADTWSHWRWRSPCRASPYARRPVRPRPPRRRAGRARVATSH